MFRKIIVPKNRQLLLQLPAEFVGKQVEVIAFTMQKEDDVSNITEKNVYKNAVDFFKKHAVDFSKIKKWTREDLYE